MLSKITIDNFRNLKNVEIKPALFTLLIGPNGTGKSGIFHAICILKQSFEQDKFSNELKIVGNQVNLGSRKEIVYNHDEKNEIKIGIEGDFTINETVSGMSSKDGTFSYELINTVFENKKNTKTNIGGIEIATDLSALAGNEIEFDFNQNKHIYKIDKADGIGIQGTFTDPELRALDPYFGTGTIESILDNIYYVPVQRGISQFKTTISSLKPKVIVTSMGTAKHTQDTLETTYYDYDLVDRISAYTKKLLGKEVRPALIPLGLGDVEQKNEVQGTAEFFDSKVRAYATNTGFGLNQVFFLLVQVLGCPSGSTILIEEPETSLHPLAQRRLIDTLITIAKKENKQIIMTSHSEHIAFALFKANIKHELEDNELSIYEFEQNDAEFSTVKKIEDSAGSLRSFLGEQSMILEYVDVFGMKDVFLEHGTSEDWDR